MTHQNSSRLRALRRPAPIAGCAVALWLAMPLPAQAQRALVNGSFEQPVITCNPASWATLSSIPGWTSAAPDGGGVSCGTGTGATISTPIEIWNSGFNGVPANDGVQFVELNGHTRSRIWQPVCLINGETFSTTFAHRGRSGADSLTVGLNPLGDTATPLAMRLDGSTITPANSPTVYVSPSGAWSTYTATATFSGATGVYQLGYEAFASFNNAAGAGNFIDNVRLNLQPVVELVPGQSIHVTEGGTALVQLRPSGTLTAALTVNLRAVNVTTSAADYTLPNGTPAAFTVQVPAGTYDGTQLVNIPIGAVADAVYDEGESLTVELQTGTGYRIGSTAACGAAGATAATVTIHEVAGTLPPPPAAVPLSPALSALMGLLLAGLGWLGLRRPRA